MPFLPVIALLSVGVVMGRSFQFDKRTLDTLLHFALIPVYLFYCLLGSLPDKQALWLIAFGAALAVGGFLVITAFHKLLKQRLPISAATANITLFALPVLTVVGNLTSNTRMALALAFVGMAFVLVFLKNKVQGFVILIGQPWLYALALAVLVRYDVIPRNILLDVTRPLEDAAIPISLLYLGTMMAHMSGLGSKDAWLSMAVRLVVGLGVGIVFVKFTPVPEYMHHTLLLAAIAPPATAGMSMIASSTRGGETEPPSIALGVIIVLAAYILFPWYVGYLPL